MATTETTTIRVPTQTRDQLKTLAKRRGESATDVVSKLVAAADEETLLAEAAEGFERLAASPEALAAYRTESAVLEGFGAPTPEW
jgi:predicted DNA-binding protein